MNHEQKQLTQNRVAEIVRYIALNGGVGGVVAMRDALGLSSDQMRVPLKSLVDDGLLTRQECGPRIYYAAFDAQDIAAKICDLDILAAEAMKSRMGKARNLSMAIARRDAMAREQDQIAAAQEIAEEDEEAIPFKHVLVAAIDAPPICPPGYESAHEFYGLCSSAWVFRSQVKLETTRYAARHTPGTLE